MHGKVDEKFGRCEVCEERKHLRSVSYYRNFGSSQNHYREFWCRDCFCFAKTLPGYYKLRRKW